ncbi:DUF1127 domain-containing protein [Pseudosulfitobacter pseudonitzschiae]|uniref:DUF1127 domain-containing protein n=1 Tax=Pseudosulfitobacter pseudonitzschiae TaxID=1402135 RepID=UPI003B7EA688
MTTQTISHPVYFPLLAGLRKLRQAWLRNITRTQTERALHSLSDRQLKDIGISRGMITTVAQRVAETQSD